MALIGLVLALAGAYLGFRVALKHYLHSDSFLAQINHATSTALRVDGEFEPLSWQDAQASSTRFTGTGKPRSPVREILAQGIEADLNFRSIWDGMWEITELSIDQAHIDLTQKSPSLDPKFSPSITHAPSTTGSSSFLSSLLPKRTQLELVKIESADITFPVPAQFTEGTDGQARAKRLRIHARPLGDRFSDGFQLSGFGGEIHLPDGQRLSLLDYETRWKDGVLYISDAIATIATIADVENSVGARVQCNGRLDTTGHATELKIHLSGIQVEDVVASDWKQRISGLIESDLTLAINREGTTINGDLSITRGVLNALPILDNLADFTKHDTFRRLPLTNVTAEFTKEDETIRFHDIVIESSGTLRVTGALDVTDGMVAGTLRVGVVPGVLRWIPGAEQKVFTQLDDGHLWTDMHVHGPLHALNEDLSSRLVTGAVVQSIEELPERAIDAGGRVINQGSSILREGLRGGINIIDGFVPFLGD
ncbi:MAG: hypothetical protein ACI9R3_003041 [Verrucomicrobiales bacterium]|jgi:hypothetical protein